MAINDQLERIIASLDELVNSGEAKSEYGLSIEDRLLRIAEQLKKIKEEGGIGGKGFTIHICSATEYDAVTRIPTITDPDLSTIYLVPTSNSSANLFDEYIFVDGAWELFGSSPSYVDITPTATVTKSGNTATITITDKNGTTTATVIDGANGTNGTNGVDGKDGKDGKDGTNGTNGADGAPGVGVPTGGTTGQVLVKKTSTNYDTEWQTPSSGGSSTLYGLQDTNFVQQALIPGDALTYSYAADGTMIWSNVPLMYSCSLAESDFGGLTTYTYIDVAIRHYNDGVTDVEFYLEQGSRMVVYDSNTGVPALFSIGFVILNNGEMDERGNMLYEVWFIDVTQGHSPLTIRRFRKTYIEDAQQYYYIEVT